MLTPKNNHEILSPLAAFFPATAVPGQKRIALTGFRWDSPPEKEPDWHHHSRGQLKWSPTGPDRVHTSQGVWVTPPGGAVWIPPGIMHHSYTDREHSVFFDAELCSILPAQCCIVVMTPQLLEALMGALDAIALKSSTASFVPALLNGVIDSELRSIEDPFPQSAATISAAQSAHREEEPGDSLIDWAQRLGLSKENMAALLKEETGMTFPHWRRQLRLLQGMRLLAMGWSVKHVAAQVGYNSPSHFTAFFKECLGTTPGHYFEPLRHRRTHGSQDESRRSTIHNERVPVRAREQKGLLSDGNSTKPMAQNAQRLAEVIAVNICDSPMGRLNRVGMHGIAKLHWPVGAQSVTTQAGTWVGHSQLAIWVPAWCEHESQFWSRQRSYRVLACPATEHLPKNPCAVRVTKELRQAMLDLIPSLKPCSRQDATSTFLQEVRASKIAPLPLSLIRAERLAPLVQALRVDPSSQRTMTDWAKELEMGRGTLVRAFESELGMTFGHFQRLMRVRRAIELLALGESVKGAANRVGYAGVAKFIAMFRGMVGVTPLRYFRQSCADVPTCDEPPRR